MAKTTSSANIPSYALYGEPYGTPFPDCLHYEALSERSRQHHWWIRPHRHHGLHQFFWIAQGRVTVASESTRRVLLAPAAVMNAPSTVHGFEWEPGSEGHVVTVPTVNLERSLPRPTTLLGRLRQSLMVQCPQDAASSAPASALFAAIAAEYHTREEGRTEALLCLSGLLALWFLRTAERTGGTDRIRERPYVTLVRRFLALAETHFHEHRPLSFYAGQLGITSTHLTRACRRQLGLSAQAAIHDRLVLEARRMLAYTPASVASIAADLGFNDPAYFTRFFSRHAGEAPGAYRRAFLEEPDASGDRV